MATIITKRIMGRATAVTPTDNRTGDCSGYGMTYCEHRSNFDIQKSCCNFLYDMFKSKCIFDNKYYNNCDVTSEKYESVLNFNEGRK